MIRSEFLPSPGRAANFDACDVSGKVRIQRVFLQVAEGSEGEDTFVLGALPPGHTILLGSMCRLFVSSTDKLKATLKFDLKLGAYKEPAGLTIKASDPETALVTNQPLKAAQSFTLAGGLRKQKAVQATEVILKTSELLPAGTVFEGYLVYSHD